MLNIARVCERRASNLFMAKFHTRYCGLVCGLHVKQVVCVTSSIIVSYAHGLEIHALNVTEP